MSIIELLTGPSRIRNVYIVCCLLGAFVPWLVFSPWVSSFGLVPLMFFQQINGNPVAAFAWLNVLLAGLPFLIFVLHEGRRIHMTRLWLPFIGFFVIGLAFAIPLFLFMREITIQPTHHPD